MKVEVMESTITEVVKIHKSIPEMLEEDEFTIRSRVEGKKHFILRAEINEIPIGYLVAYVRDNDGSLYIWLAGVLQKYRRRGVMTALFAEVLLRAREGKHKKIKIKTMNRYNKMLSFLAKRKYQLVDLEKGENFEQHKMCFEKDI